MPLNKIKNVLEWLPVLQFVQDIVNATPGKVRIGKIAVLAEYLAARTSSTVDDKITDLLRRLLLTEPGQELIDYIADLVNKVDEGGNDDE
jgi:hypothetical protein